tara:strand:+ start:246 stop:587 length:342 start_codon:yes stop_codon:yes gene_type:complete
MFYSILQIKGFSMHIHIIEEHSIEGIIAIAKKMEAHGYIFHITPREWVVRLRTGQVLECVTVIPDGDAGGLSDREFRRLSFENFKLAVDWSMTDLQKRLRSAEDHRRISARLR